MDGNENSYEARFLREHPATTLNMRAIAIRYALAALAALALALLAIYTFTPTT
jgi:hypothetical protein